MACKGGTLKSGTDNYYPNAYYKVGDLFLTTRNENPSLRFGGIWELFGKGKTLVCVDENDNDFETVKRTGGEKEHAHSAGSLGACMEPSNDFSNMTFATKKLDESYVLTGYVGGMSKTSGGGSSGVGVDINGNTSLASNLQPYITCYIWIRTE